MSRRRAAAGGGLAVAAAAIAAVAAGAVPGGNDDERPQAATIATATTEVRRQDLIDVETEDGTLGHGDSRAVMNRLSGTVTWLPAEGAVVKPDGRLYEVDGSPVILMDGRLPAYRELGASVSDGPDVAQLERNLRALGYDPDGTMALDDSWDTGTTAAVLRWQEAHDLEETGTVELGRVIFQPGRRRVASIDVTLGGDTTGGGAGADQQASTAAEPQTMFASFEQPEPDDRARELERQEQELKRREAELERRERELREQQERQQQQQAQPRQQEEQEQAEQPQSNQQSDPQAGTGDGAVGGGSVGAGSAGGASEGEASGGRESAGRDEGGASEGAAAEVMTTTTTRPVVTVELDTAKVSLAREGARVTVELPSGASARGRIASVGKVATAPSEEAENPEAGSATEDATVEVTIRMSRRTPALDQAPVTVSFERSRRRDVLAVPVTALLARSGGTFAVEVRDGGARRIVPVTPGLYTSGYVEIEGEGLREGMRVTDARI